jgi:hypothetical protein
LKGKDFKELFNELIRKIDKDNKLNMRALWILDKRLVEPWKYPKRYEIYPAVAFIANISEKME